MRNLFSEVFLNSMFILLLDFISLTLEFIKTLCGEYFHSLYPLEIYLYNDFKDWIYSLYKAIISSELRALL